MMEDTYAIPRFVPSSLESWTSDDLLEGRIPKEVMNAKLRLLKREMMAAIRAKDVCSVQAYMVCIASIHAAVMKLEKVEKINKNVKKGGLKRKNASVSCDGSAI